MRDRLRRYLTGVVLVLLLAFAPTTARADVGSNIVSRFWDSMMSTARERMVRQAPNTVKILQEAENVFLGQTEDITTHSAIQDVYKAMRTAGLLLLALCTVISLAELTDAGMMGHSTNFLEWFKRFCVAAFMTMGGIHFYGLWIRIFNLLLTGFRTYLDTQYQGPNDPSVMYTQLLPQWDNTNTFLMLLFAVLTLAVLFVLWFLIGGIRMAELAVAVVIAPLVWPVYLIHSLEDIPKSAFRMFLGLNALLLIVVAMLRMAVRMVSGGGLANTVWNYVPAISLLLLTIFLPSMIKRLIGQGHTGTGALTTIAYAVAGLKGIQWAAGGTAAASSAAAAPPTASAVPQAPPGPSSYPVAPVGATGAAPSAPTPQSAPMEQVWVDTPSHLPSGATSAYTAGLEAPSHAKDAVIDLGQSNPGSNQFDMVIAVEKLRTGMRAAKQIPSDHREG